MNFISHNRQIIIMLKGNFQNCNFIPKTHFIKKEKSHLKEYLFKSYFSFSKLFTGIYFSLMRKRQVDLVNFSFSNFLFLERKKERKN